MNRLSVLQWRSGTRGLSRHLSLEAQDPCAAKHHFEGGAERCEKDANYRKCMQEDSRTYETMESCDKIATWLREPVVCFSNYGWKIQYDTNASTS